MLCLGTFKLLLLYSKDSKTKLIKVTATIFIMLQNILFEINAVLLNFYSSVNIIFEYFYLK